MRRQNIIKFPSGKSKYDLVLPIKGEIERTLGLRCWIDLSDIPCGSENFKRNVIPGIRQTRIAFLFFFTVESQMSEYAMKEIGFARNPSVHWTYDVRCAENQAPRRAGGNVGLYDGQQGLSDGGIDALSRLHQPFPVHPQAPGEEKVMS